MGRPLRIEVPDGFYHVHARGNDRRDIYFGNWSGRLFVRELERASRRHGWRILAYCLMPNDYDAVLQIHERLSSGMTELNGRFARTTNRVTGRMNHLFGSPFKSHLIEDEAYLLDENWRWSSMRATLGLEHPPACLDVAFVLRCFGSRTRVARGRFRDWVNEELSRSPTAPSTGRAVVDGVLV